MHDFLKSSAPTEFLSITSEYGRARSGFGAVIAIDSLANSGITCNLWNKTLEIDFLWVSSIMMHIPSLPAKKMKGMWQTNTIMKAI